MAERTNRDAVRGELIRLLEGLEFYRSWAISSLKRDKGTVTKDDLDQIVLPGSFFLQIFDDTKGSRCAEVLKEVRQWYSHAASDLFNMANFGEEALAAEANEFLKDFRKEVGFDFYAEARLLRKTADEALKLRKITNPEDYYSLKELENDLSQSVISSNELARVSDLLRQFENQFKAH